MKIIKLTESGDLANWLMSIKSRDYPVALDLETTGLTRCDSILSGAITGPENSVAFFNKELVSELSTASPDLEFVFHNASFDLKMLAWHGVHLHKTNKFHDTMILAHLLDENKELGLGKLVERIYGDGYKESFWKRVKEVFKNQIKDVPEKDLSEYNAKDVKYTKELYGFLSHNLKKEGVPSSLIEHVHFLQKSLLETEIKGIAIDINYLTEKGVELKKCITSLLPRMYECVRNEIDVIELEEWSKEIAERKTPKGKSGVKRPEFSFDSPKQLMALLYQQLGLKVQYKESTKKPTCDSEALDKLMKDHPIIPLLQEYREINKIYGTYIEGIMDRMVDGRIYPSFNVTGTATGRISHQNPNMGNMPKYGGIRGMFIPDQGYVFISADFSQLEVCLSAHFTRDENLLRIVNEGASQHDITAASLGIKRDLAKTINFGMQYGCSHYKVAKVLGVTEGEGKKAYDKYWDTYKGQKKVMDECAKRVDNGTPIINPFGRRRRFEVINRRPWDSAYRQSWNALVQSTGSDCTSRAFYLTDHILRNRGIGRALFTIHDEIVCQVKENDWKEAQKILVDTMVQVGVELGLTVELKAESSGPMIRWED